MLQTEESVNATGLEVPKSTGCPSLGRTLLVWRCRGVLVRFFD